MKIIPIIFKFRFAFLILLFFYNCTQKSELAMAFDCENQLKVNNLKTIDDIQKKYRIKFPTHWKSSLYFDAHQSDIYLADTTKSLSNTYILSISNKAGMVEINEHLKENVMANLHNQQLKIVRYEPINFLSTPAVFYHANGHKKSFSYHQLIILKPSINSYYELKIELYGDKNIDKRLCEAIYYINQLHIY